MPAPRWLARFNRRLPNKLLGPLASRLPGWGVIVHTGRKTGRDYRAPVFVFRHDDTFVIALTYGPESDWVRNVLARGGCILETRGGTVRLTHPRLFSDEHRRGVPPLIGRPLRLLNVSDFLELSIVDAGDEERRVAPTQPARRIDHASLPIVPSPSGLPSQHLVTAGDGAQHLFVGQQWLQPGQRVLLHTHPVEEALTFLSGSGEAVLGAETVPIGAGVSLYIPAGVIHGFRCTEGTLHVIVVFPTPEFAPTTIVEETPPD